MSKIFAFSDAADTGFGRVSKSILPHLHNMDNMEVVQLGLNYFGDVHDMPFHIYPTSPADPYARGTFQKYLFSSDPDILFTINDIWAHFWMLPHVMKFRQLTGKKLPWVAYMPIDGTPLDNKWLHFVNDHIDIPVFYTKMCYDLVKPVVTNENLRYIYHGSDSTVFKPLSDEDRAEQMAAMSEAVGRDINFVVGYVGRNQHRKRIPELMTAYKQFAVGKDDVMLYLHTPNIEPKHGWHIDRLKTVLQFPEDYIAISKIDDVKTNYPVEQLNNIYNMMDIIALPTVGEGFGLPLVEGMSTGAVPMTTNCMSAEEILGGVGALIEPQGYTFLMKDNELLRPIPSVNEMAQAMDALYDMKKNDPSGWATCKQDCVNRGKFFDGWFLDQWEDVFRTADNMLDTKGLDYILD